MEDASFWELLFSKESMAGVWAVIGGFIALLGIFANNLWENSRQKKELEHALIRDAYFGAVEYSNYYTHKIFRIGQLGLVEPDSNDVAASEKLYKLFLIGSPEVIDAFTKLSLKFSDIIIKLSASAMDLQTCSSECKSHQLEIDNALKIMDQVNLNKKEYVDKNQNIPELWNLFDEHFEQAQQDFNSHGEKIEVVQRQEFELKIKLLKECIELSLTTYPGTHDAIFMMRSDLDRKLNKKDSEKIKGSINFQQEQLKTSLTDYIEKLRLRISEMDQEE
ncbi:MAG: hypothetical protein WD425_14430 [Nitrospirales bacterium]